MTRKFSISVECNWSSATDPLAKLVGAWATARHKADTADKTSSKFRKSSAAQLPSSKGRPSTPTAIKESHE